MPNKKRSRLGDYVKYGEVAAEGAKQLVRLYQRSRRAKRNQEVRRQRNFRNRPGRNYKRRVLFRRKQSKRLQLLRMGVGQTATRRTIIQAVHRIDGTANASKYEFINQDLGLNDITTMNQIYTNEGMADERRQCVKISENFTFYLKNQSDMSCYVTIYEVILKRDWNTGYNAMGGDIGTELIDKGFSQMGADESPAVDPGVSINWNDKFKQWFRIAKTTATTFAPGVTRKYVMKKNLIRKDNFNYKYESTITHRKGTRLVLLRVQGVPVHSTLDTGVIGLSIPRLDVYMHKTCAYRILSNIVSTMVESNALTAPTDPLGAVDEDVEIAAQEQ